MGGLANKVAEPGLEPVSSSVFLYCSDASSRPLQVCDMKGFDSSKLPARRLQSNNPFPPWFGRIITALNSTVYQKHEPIFFQSIGNPFIFRCLDGMLIDGNDKGISKVVYRTLRYVPEDSKDKIIPDEDVLGTLLKVFQALFISNFSRQTDILLLLPEAIKSKYRDLLVTHQRTEQPRYNTQQQKIYKPGEVLFNTLGFSISRETSSLISAGKGVFVTKGFVPKGTVVSMYPGTVYQKHEPIFFQSIGNPFIFRCLDGMLIDGNDKGISKVVYSPLRCVVLVALRDIQQGEELFSNYYTIIN